MLFISTRNEILQYLTTPTLNLVCFHKIGHIFCVYRLNTQKEKDILAFT